MSCINRRSFMVAAASLPVASSLRCATAAPSPQAAPPAARPGWRPVVIASGNGLPAVNRAMEALRNGADPLDAVVDGIALVEDDPDDMSVGLGGLPNEKGIVELDASVMHGPSHKAGAVAALRNIRNPSRVALRVLRRTDHVMLVGEGALEFARGHGFQEENLLTDKAREAWLKWKENLSPDDDWLDDHQKLDRPGKPAGGRTSSIDVPFTWGTIHGAAVDSSGNLGACTSTSGLSYKLPGRVGDSPIIGAGMFVDNDIGAAGATGRGEAVIQSCGSFQIVRHMAEGLDPQEACLRVLKWIADHTRLPMLLNRKGEPDFQVTMYALRKDGAFGSASMRKGATFSVHDGVQGRVEPSAYLFE